MVKIQQYRFTPRPLSIDQLTTIRIKEGSFTNSLTTGRKILSKTSMDQQEEIYPKNGSPILGKE